MPVLSRAWGMADLEHGIPNTPSTIFEGGSLAKQFTSAAVVLLALDGKLSLDDDVRTHIPEVRGLRRARDAPASHDPHQRNARLGLGGPPSPAGDGASARTGTRTSSTS